MPADALGNQLSHRMLHQARIATVQEARRQARNQVQPPIGLAQQ